MASQRISQINELIKTLANEFITRELEIPFDCFVTISKIETSPDLHYSKILITVIPDNKRGTALKILRTHQKQMQKFIASNIKFKFMPKLSFDIDEQVIYGNKIDELLNSIQ